MSLHLYGFLLEHLGKQPGNGNLYQWCNWKTIIKERFNTGITKIHPKITSKCVSNHVHNIYSSGCINSYKFKLKEIPDNVDEVNRESACTFQLKISSRAIGITHSLVNTFFYRNCVSITCRNKLLNNMQTAQSAALLY